MSTAVSILTIVHVLLSLVGIGSGFIVIRGLIGSQKLESWTVVFLATTVATSVTAFMFPFGGITPGIVLAMISLVALAITIAARYKFHLLGGWRAAYVIAAVLAQYLNFFVLIVQCFQKIPSLRALAPTQSEPPFAIAQLVALIAFLVLGVLSTLRFRPQSLHAA